MKLFTVGVYNSYIQLIQANYLQRKNFHNTTCTKLNININKTSKGFPLMSFYQEFLHLQFSPFHSFINNLNLLTHGESFIVSGRLFLRILPLKANELVP